MFFKNHGILGINARNLLYIRPYNPKKAIKLADDKLKTKQFLAARGIPVPKTYGIIRNWSELDKFDFNSLPHSFVIKPNNGFGGEGIIPIVNKRENYWIKTNGEKITKEEIKDHIKDILDGMFSISGIVDTAFFEQLIVSDDTLGKYSYQGLPDLRIVVHNLIPVMAMLRLPTKESGGKANLHQGAVAVGIDIAKGETTFIAHKNKIINELPNELGEIHKLKIPFWDNILFIASKIQLITNLGYLAADVAIDKHTGPVLIEINARAGLSVQIANLAPLRKRLERIEGIKVTSPMKGIRIAKDMFGNVVEKEIKQLSGKQIIGSEEYVEIIQKNGTLRILAKIDTGKERSVIDESFAVESGLLENPEAYNDEQSTLKVKLSIKEKRIQTVTDIEKIPSEKYKIIIGNRDLKDFLIDTNIIKSKTKTLITKQEEPLQKQSPVNIAQKMNYYEIDQKLVQIDSKIKLLYHLRPVNLESEKTKFFKDFNTNPKFEYPDLKFDPLELIDELNKIELDDSPLGEIFEEKKAEILKKIELLESIDEENFTNLSIDLFGKPTEEDVSICDKHLKDLKIKSLIKESANLSALDAKTIFEEVFQKYKLTNWKVKIKEGIVADCVAGKHNTLFVKNNAHFSNSRLKSLIIHEIETHILTAENGKNQPYEIFNRGLANYLITQEGLAIYNVEKQNEKAFKENYKPYLNVTAINQAIQGSFVETFENLLKYGITMEEAFRSALKAKRGFCDTSKKGAFTKDYLYYNGHRMIKQFIENNGDIKELYIGKINIKDLGKIKLINGIVKAKNLPFWLRKEIS